jgi:hypothetical protein
MGHSMSAFIKSDFIESMKHNPVKVHINDIPPENKEATPPENKEATPPENKEATPPENNEATPPDIF